MEGVTYAIPPTRLIHLHLDPTEIGKNYPVEVGIVADARARLAALLEWFQSPSASCNYAKNDRVKNDYTNSDYFAHMQRLREKWLAEQRAQYEREQAEEH